MTYEVIITILWISGRYKKEIYELVKKRTEEVETMGEVTKKSMSRFI